MRSDALSFWTDSRGTQFVRTARRANQSAQAWAAEHVSQILGSQASTAPASGTGDPKVTTISFTLAGQSSTCEVRTFQASGESEAAWQAVHDEEVAAIRQGIIDAGGTIQ